MPFTPLHMGPGIAIKSVMQGAFSLMVFGWAQIVMDIQPLIVIITGEGHLHGFSHTFIGAGLLGLFSALTGKYLAEIGLQLLRWPTLPLRWWVVFLSAFIGTFSHVLLDAVMHGDVQPFYPMDLNNPWWRWVAVDTLHRFCLYSGALGALLYGVVVWIWRSKTKTAHQRAP